jgi:hypothetical protein
MPPIVRRHEVVPLANQFPQPGVFFLRLALHRLTPFSTWHAGAKKD